MSNGWNVVHQQNRNAGLAFHAAIAALGTAEFPNKLEHYNRQMEEAAAARLAVRSGDQRLSRTLNPMVSTVSSRSESGASPISPGSRLSGQGRRQKRNRDPIRS